QSTVPIGRHVPFVAVASLTPTLPVAVPPYTKLPLISVLFTAVLNVTGCMEVKSRTVLPSLETLTTSPPPPVVEPCTPPESNVALTPLPFQLPTTHELATPPVLPPDPLPDTVEDPDPDALGVADSLDPLDVQAASPRVSPTATTASLVIRIEPLPTRIRSPYTPNRHGSSKQSRLPVPARGVGHYVVTNISYHGILATCRPENRCM